VPDRLPSPLKVHDGPADLMGARLSALGTPRWFGARHNAPSGRGPRAGVRRITSAAIDRPVFPEYLDQPTIEDRIAALTNAINPKPEGVGRIKLLI